MSTACSPAWPTRSGRHSPEALGSTPKGTQADELRAHRPIGAPTCRRVWRRFFVLYNEFSDVKRVL
jgi:hypothetical protein